MSSKALIKIRNDGMFVNYSKGEFDELFSLNSKKNEISHLMCDTNATMKTKEKSAI